MGDEGPKLFASKPKKSMLKASSTGATAPPPPHLPPHPKASSRSRYRILVPLVLALNFSIGAYVLVKTTLRDKRVSEEEIPEGSTSSTSSTSTSISEAQITATNSRRSTA